jgi:hypothetical protein
MSNKVGPVRVQVVDAKPKVGATQKALKAGPHGSVTHADGSSQASPNPHKPTDGGQGGMNGMKDVKDSMI